MIKLKKIRPMFDGILTTAEKYEDIQTKDGLIDEAKKSGALKELQKVLAVGPAIKDIKVGDMVCVNPSRFAIHMHKDGSLHDGVIEDNQVLYYNFPIIEVDDKECLLIANRDIDFIVDEFNEVKDDDIIQ